MKSSAWLPQRHLQANAGLQVDDLVDFCSLFGTILGPFWDPKMTPKRCHFLIDFLMQFWCPKWSQRGPKMDPKTDQKPCRNLFIYENAKKLILLYSTMKINGFQVLWDLFLALVGAIFGAWNRDHFRIDFLSEKVVPKGSQMGPKKGPEMDRKSFPKMVAILKRFWVPLGGGGRVRSYRRGRQPPKSPQGKS